MNEKQKDNVPTHKRIFVDGVKARIPQANTRNSKATKKHGG